MPDLKGTDESDAQLEISIMRLPGAINELRMVKDGKPAAGVANVMDALRASQVKGTGVFLVALKLTQDRLVRR